MTCDPVPLRYLKASLPGEDVAAGSVRRVTVDSAVGTAMEIDLLQKTSLNGEQEYKKRCAT